MPITTPRSAAFHEVVTVLEAHQASLLLRAGTPLDLTNIEKAFKGVLKAADLPLHFSPHGLRHTFASLLLQAGVSPA